MRIRTGDLRPHPPLIVAMPEPGARMRLVQTASAADATVDTFARLYVSGAGAALRTILGNAHRHVIGVYPSWKTQLSQPWEGLGEAALAQDSDIDPEVHDFQTQAFRLRMLVGTARVEWICDHLRQMRDGTVEAIEVKQHPSQMDAEYQAKLRLAADILGRIGWRVRVRYEREIVGCPARELNRGFVAAHRSIHVDEDSLAAFERLRAGSPATTFGALRREIDGRRVQGEAKAHALIAAAMVGVDLDALIHDGSPVELRPTPRFNSKIRL